jgi:hypothetical protein
VVVQTVISEVMSPRSLVDSDVSHENDASIFTVEVFVELYMQVARSIVTQPQTAWSGQ